MLGGMASAELRRSMYFDSTTNIFLHAACMGRKAGSENSHILYTQVAVVAGRSDSTKRSVDQPAYLGMPHALIRHHHRSDFFNFPQSPTPVFLSLRGPPTAFEGSGEKTLNITCILRNEIQGRRMCLSTSAMQAKFGIFHGLINA